MFPLPRFLKSELFLKGKTIVPLSVRIQLQKTENNSSNFKQTGFNLGTVCLQHYWKLKEQTLGWASRNDPRSTPQNRTPKRLLPELGSERRRIRTSLWTSPFLATLHSTIQNLVAASTTTIDVFSAC